MKSQSLKLPLSLRDELKNPLGELIEGTIDETGKILIKMLKTREGLLVGVGDVTANVLIDLDLKPEIVVTDGYTKREELDLWRDYENYEILHTSSPAAIITKKSWDELVNAINIVLSRKAKVHVKIEGEEDLLVLPLILELPEGAFVVYGQPNVGVVVRLVTKEAKSTTLKILEKMERI